MNLDSSVIAFVSSGASWAQPAERALRTGGSRVIPCSADRQLWVTLTQEQVDLVVMGDTGKTLGRGEVLELLLEEPETRHLPRLILLGPQEQVSASLYQHAPVLTLAASAPGEVVRATCQGLLRTASTGAEEEWNLVRVRKLCERLDTLAHDARTLIGVAVGFASNLRDGVTGPLPEPQKEAVARILEAMGDAVRLLDDDAWRAASHETDSPPSATSYRGERPRVLVDLHSLVRSIARLFQESARERRIAIETDGDSGVQLWANTLELKQIVLNLVSNAIKFTPRGGKVTIGVRAGARGVGDECQLVVTDTGKGLSEEEKQRIFDYGTQFPKGISGPGRGVGLYVVKKIVESYKGRILVDSTPGKGTSLSVCLPADPRVSISPTMSDNNAKEIALIRMLVENNSSETLRRLLAEDPAVVATAIDAAKKRLQER